MLSIILILAFQLQEPIYEINRKEAELHRLFSDVDSFVSAKFYNIDDSISIVFIYTAKGDTFDSTMDISKDAFEGLQFYQKNFHRIITDLNFRNKFLHNYEIGWPVISMKKIGERKNKELSNAIFNNVCCMTGTGATGAYIGALVGKTIHKKQDIFPVACRNIAV